MDVGVVGMLPPFVGLPLERLMLIGSMTLVLSIVVKREDGTDEKKGKV
jgi:hypothetical protein